MEEHIVGLDIWEQHDRRVIYKGLDSLEDTYHVDETRIYDVW